MQQGRTSSASEEEGRDGDDFDRTQLLLATLIPGMFAWAVLLTLLGLVVCHPRLRALLLSALKRTAERPVDMRGSPLSMIKHDPTSRMALKQAHPPGALPWCPLSGSL